MKNLHHISISGRALLLSLLLLLCINANAQTGGIVIQGDVYGGGNHGAVGTDNAKSTVTDETVPTQVKMANEGDESNTATQVTIYDGTIRTVFGGGKDGRTYGSTSVKIQGNGTTIGNASLKNTVNGGVFGAGDGAGAYVFGHSNVLIKGGTIAQNVYGGGNKADLMGTTKVTLQGGTLSESVFGGSRLANIYGYSLVDIDGAQAAQNLEIKAIYGGNDIAGHIEASDDWDWTALTQLELPAGVFQHTTENSITSIEAGKTVTRYNSFVHSSLEASGKHIFVGQVFGGGNGDYGKGEGEYEYEYDSQSGKYKVSALGTTFEVASRPEVQRSYIELQGGTFGYVYGGGNNATVTHNVDICLDNTTSTQNLHEISTSLLSSMGVSTNSTFTNPTENTVKPTYQFDRVFGGNNKAEMDIQPQWHLINAKINNLYSGGNEGDMTFKRGLLLKLNAPGIEVNNVYGGSRRANVIPKNEDGTEVSSIPAPPNTDFEDGYSARILITAGTINNVYGGNDISGIVKGGNAIDIRSSILGDVYGGGNGSYFYTGKTELADNDAYRDFYYPNPSNKPTIEALNDFRPNAEQSWIHVSGSADKHTLIGGSLYCGGNSATLSIAGGDNNKTATLKIGSYVVIDKVFLGSNGEKMIDAGILADYNNQSISSFTMNNANFAEYIKGVSLGIRPTISFDEGYIERSTQIGSFFIGGNLGSITADGTFNVTFREPIIIYDKLVAGCNDANYQNTTYGINYKGGITSNTGIDNDGVKIRLNIDNITLLPKKIVRDNDGKPTFDQNNNPVLDWNITTPETDNTNIRRLKGANIYGGCYSSGYVNGGVEININGPAMDDDMIFDDPKTKTITENSGIIKETQQQDVFGRAMSVFGGGMGENTEIWGNTTINIGADGYILQAFGGGERGIVGKDLGDNQYTAYNATVNLNGGAADEIYGGGFEGLVTGNTTVNIKSGNAVDVFGGACNANVGGLASVYVGGDANGASNLSIPTIDNVFGGNDYSGRIGTLSGLANKTGYNNEIIATNTYVEYIQGAVDSIFGGSYGSYPEDYSAASNAPEPPFVESTFINFKPNSEDGNAVKYVFGGGWGDPTVTKNNEMQQRSYVLVNAPDNIDNFINTEIFGSGAFSGLGMNKTPAQASAAPADVTAKVVLASGKVHNVYGASFKSGFTRRTEVSVPSGSTANVYSIFGGGYGDNLGLVCDTYESHVKYSSSDAVVRTHKGLSSEGKEIDINGAIYGGNNNSRRTFYSFVDIESPVYSNKTNGYTAPVYGGGYGADTWTQYTEINLKNGANVYEVYGGGEGGMVLNKESVDAFTTYTYKDGNQDKTGTVAKTIGSGYDDLDATLDHGGLTNALVHANRFPTENGQPLRTNTNVYVWKGATVGGYAYGAGLGETALVSGTTYFGVHGGIVVKDLYAAGTSGAVNRLNNTLTFTPETYTYLEGGSVRNIYGGGWKGNIGSTTDNIQGNSHVVIGTLPENFIANESGYNEESIGFYKGTPTVQRNAYAGGEGGAVYGMANLTMNNGRIGYEYVNGDYVEKIEDETHKDNEGNLIPNTNLKDSGNIFGGGYKEESDVDNTNILMLGGIVRNSLYGGGEIATVGHGIKSNTAGAMPTIQKKGKTHVEMYSGQVLHDVFGGGKGFDNLGRVGENLHTDGWVFGSTEVYIYGGKVGSEAGVKDGYGNVFGGGNVGYVYSGDGTKSATDGYYYDSNNKLTEDCRVVVSPYAKVLTDDVNGVTLSLRDTLGTLIKDSTFYKNQYVPTEYLNSLNKEWISNDKKNKKLDWVSGVNIYNAVFAGGNVSSGSNVLYANTKTVFGNATATLNDVYHCDLITVGTEHIGGVYGDGNLTFVDGYRELNITNYGTDYYGQSDVITLAQYNDMNDRERAYFELKYKCVQECTDNNNNDYSIGASLAEDDLRKNFRGNSTILIPGDPSDSINAGYWVKSGFCSIYAGRLLNTIQRADFVGVFGSRMVMQGARDRVPSVVDYTDYTINRVGEVSLNQNHSRAGDTGEQASFGNYFGIYNIVNHLGALTSDVDYYKSVRTTSNKDPNYKPDEDTPNQTYAQWKIRHIDDRKRNNGSSPNKVALAAGVYLELTTEKSTPEEKDWGIATGVMELDLINVMPGLGGGYVYAKNVHGVRNNVDGGKQVTLSKYNEGANSKKKYDYSAAGQNDKLQTSGNFIHSQKQIFDDCYPQSNAYTGEDPAPAHYWFIKGQIYLYNQYISAYTGAADAYSKTINIPLTVTAGSHGTLKLQNVQPNKYAYYNNNHEKLEDDATTMANNVTYHLNDTITYWEWSMLSETDQKKFVDTTYVTIADCEIGSNEYPKGSVFLPSEFKSMKQSAPDKVIEGQTVKAVYHKDKEAFVPFTDVFRISNNISHDNGYILTFDVTNPEDWNTYYSPLLRTTGNKKSTNDYSELPENDKLLYQKAPTYTPSVSNVYGQRLYTKGEIITYAVKNTFDTKVYEHLTDAQRSNAAKFERAYVLTKKVTIQNEDNTETYLNAGYVMPETEYELKQIGDNGAEAWYCTNTFELKRDGFEDQFIYQGRNLTEAQIEDLVRNYICYEDGTTSQQIQAKLTEIKQNYFTQSYYCTDGGKYGGSWFESGHNYSGIEAWSSLTEADREYFTFNYDGLDLIIDPKYRGDAKYYDSSDGNPTTPLYSEVKALDYNAVYTGSTALEYKSSDGTPKTIAVGAPAVGRAVFEDIPNERYHYVPFSIESDNETVYIVKESFLRGDVPYAVGNKIDAETFGSLGDDLKLKVDRITGTSGKYYYCRDAYTVDAITERGKPVTAVITNGSINQGTTINRGSRVNIGFIIDETQYLSLINLQNDFNIYGKTPVVTSTFYVSGQSNIQDLSKGRIMTLIYQYNYEESDETGSNIEPITERHIVNIHIQFKSGTPTIGQLGEPSIVLPGSSVGLTTPSVKPGAYEVIGGGWELFPSTDQAEKHVNGVEFDNVDTKLYWYQNNNYHIAYYAKTYLGKTYSNPVKVRVANYHDLDMVMRDKEHHMYIDNPNVERNSKIYFDGRNCVSDQDKSKLDLLKDLFDLSITTTGTDANGDPLPVSGGELDGHVPLDDHVKGLKNLEFILRGDVAPKKYTTWNSIGSGNDCFEGNLHGDGYTISGLDHSLFGSLCGNVYNLGVTGTFTGSGISEHGGYAENCWIMTTGTIQNDTKAIMATGVAKNSYYPDGLGYTNITGTNAMPLTAFHNGEVAYNLNGFYLTKRYLDNNAVDTYRYKYYEIADNSTNTLNSNPSEGYYTAAEARYTYGDENVKTIGYVESRYIDGDFIFANGSIPTSANERRYFVTTPANGTPDPDNGLYYPIWPDDYIYFGQMLSYGYTQEQGREYQQTPSRINKADYSNASQWLVKDDINEFSNRVYRAPAYYGSKNPDIVHYNSYAVIPAKTSDGTTDIYPGLTAIDFTAVSDVNAQQKVLDHNKLIKFLSNGQTKNLLAYSDDNDDAVILRNYFNEPTYSQINSDYRNVAVVGNDVKGHLVIRKASGYESDGDHFLVDKQDFNVPISYSFGQNQDGYDNYMWYQRTPGLYVSNTTSGWETVSLPFTAELVTTQDKGEITHFYTGSTIGHEYWLREFNTVAQDAQDNTKTNSVFKSLAADDNSDGKDVRSVTFLWDYYYNHNSRLDKNSDEYQRYYQPGNASRNYTDYPLLAATKPYLIGFPGDKYYEFDLSGNFIPNTTATSPDDAPAKLAKQVITFVSGTRITVGVTDDECTPVVGTNMDYAFVPTYQKKTAQNDQTIYLIADDGTKFVAADASTTTVPFRAYMTGPAAQQSGGESGSAPQRIGTRADALYISYLGDSDSMEEVAVDRNLTIYSQDMKIFIENTLEYSTTITITTVAGKTLKQFTIQPGTKVTVPVNSRGVYIVNHQKIAVTR